MRTLNALQVKRKLKEDPSINLVMTLSPKAFAKSHIPGSINIYDMKTATIRLPKHAQIIVYCSDVSCMASYQAYRQLEQAGYQHIWRFSGGLVEWAQHELPLESGKEDTMLFEFVKNGNL